MIRVGIGFMLSSLLVGSAFAAETIPGEVECNKGIGIEKVKALVAKARDGLKASREATLKEIISGDKKWKDGDFYVFVYEGEKGKVIAHGYNSAMVGKELGGVKDTDGIQFNDNMRKVSMAKGEGCIKFKFPNPSKGGKIEDKIGYALKVDDHTFVGSGTYLLN